jgi:signal-transduction protein with cAMP-binding, CBS, and nucleotidyltransferase domain|tara:strand:+ start:364 stop:576 length:213 start_codon:yes stop_codon:yes gene_type:complete
MSAPLDSIDAESNMLKAFYVMQQRNIRHLTVTEGKNIIGILSIKDIANFYIGKFGQKVEKSSKNESSKAE